IGGVLVHDLGKLIELSGPVITEYTLEGKLLGHISIMQAKLTSVAKEQKIEGEEVTLLRHMILSHHGVYEYGSPVLPMIPEAEILYFIDNMDARMNTMEKALNQVEPGEFTPRIFALENRMFYKSKLVKE
ncbi:MAG: HD domain-containing protein, partial [Erysipelotrichaceae bacterium]